MIYAIKHDVPGHLWCGLAALSATTGYPVSQCIEAVQEAVGQRSDGRRMGIRGISKHNMLRALDTLGYAASSVHLVRPYPTLRQWAKARTPELRGLTTIVNVTGHYVVVTGRRFVDNVCRDPVLLSDAPGLKRRVRAFIIVEEKK